MDHRRRAESQNPTEQLHPAKEKEKAKAPGEHTTITTADDENRARLAVANDTDGDTSGSHMHTHIQGNVTADAKRACITTLRYFVSTKGQSYGADVGKSLRLVEVNIRGVGAGAGAGGRESTRTAVVAETVFEITAEKEMCNVLGTLHGACAAYIVDLCSSSSLVALGTAQGFDGTGVSQSMSLIWHHPIHLGEKIRVVSTVVSGQTRIRTMRSELWVKDRLCISSVHSTVNVALRLGHKNNICKKAATVAMAKL